MMKKIAVTCVIAVLIAGCADTSLHSDEARKIAFSGTHNGSPTYEFINEWDTRPLPRKLRDTLLKRSAVRFCEDYQILSRTPAGKRAGPSQMIVGTPLFMPTTLESEKVRIVCPS